MISYKIITRKFEFGDNKFEQALNNDFGLKINSIASGDEDTLVYEAERERRLTSKEIGQLLFTGGVYLIRKI